MALEALRYSEIGSDIEKWAKLKRDIGAIIGRAASMY
jgi:hypothetical protein